MQAASGIPEASTLSKLCPAGVRGRKNPRSGAGAVCRTCNAAVFVAHLVEGLLPVNTIVIEAPITALDGEVLRLPRERVLVRVVTIVDGAGDVFRGCGAADRGRHVHGVAIAVGV